MSHQRFIMDKGLILEICWRADWRIAVQQLWATHRRTLPVPDSMDFIQGTSTGVGIMGCRWATIWAPAW